MTHSDINASYLLIIGAMKAGTSSLFEYLSQHPEICSSQIKEPEFFSSKQNHGKQVSFYRDLWPHYCLQHKYLMEASTGYTKYPAETDVAKRIYESGLKPKFIYIVREPLARIESHFNFMRRNPDWAYKINDSQLIKVSDYYLQLSQFVEYFPKEDICIVDFEELISTPEIVLEKVCNFLGLSFKKLPRSYVHANETVVLTSTERAVKKLIGNRLLPFIPRKIKQVTKNVFGVFAKRDKQRLDAKQRAEVMNELKGNMLKFEEEYGVDVQKWGFKK